MNKSIPYYSQDWGIDAYKWFHLEAPRRGMCVAESVMFYVGMDFVEAAHKIIAAEAKVRYLLTIRCLK